MAEAIGLTGALLAIIDKTVKTIEFINTAKNAFKDQEKLREEADSLLPVLTKLKRKAEQVGNAKSQFHTDLSGVLDQMDTALKQINMRIESRKGRRRIGRVITWPLAKKDCAEILAGLERLKSLVQLILQLEVLQTTENIQSDTDQIGAIKLQTSAIEDGIVRLEDGTEDRARQKVIHWLSPINFFLTQKDIASRRLEGSGRWFLETPEFQRWSSSQGQTLWCSGMPGMGKTVLTSVIVDHLQKEHGTQPKVGIACVYCKWNEADKQTATNLLAGVWRQLAYDREISKEASDLYNSCSPKQTRLDMSETWQVLKSTLGDFTKVFIVVDALDECSPTERIFVEKLSTTFPALNLLITSRDSPSLAMVSQDLVHVRLEANLSEIRSYVEARVQNDHRLKTFIRDDSHLGQQVVDQVSSKTKGMFLIAKLHMDTLCHEDNLRDLRLALEVLPEELNESYDTVWTRINHQAGHRARRRAKQMMAWIGFSRRPLTVSELQCAMSIEPGDKNLNEEALPDMAEMLTNCAGTVRIDPESDLVHFVHYTFQDYFMSRLALPHFSKAQSEIVKTCVNCLSFDVMSRLFRADNLSEIESLFEEISFLSYAIEHWGDHARGDLEREDSVCKAILDFLDEPCRVFAAAIFRNGSSAFVNDPKPSNPGLPKSALALWLAVYHQLEHITLILLKQQIDVNQRIRDWDLPLNVAARKGSQNMVRLLIDKGADVNERSWVQIRSPLHQASIAGHEHIMKMLLGAGAKIDSLDREGNTPLFHAVTSKNTASISTLVRAGANLNHASNGWSLFHEAAFQDDVEVLNTLFSLAAEVGCDVDLKGAPATKIHSVLYVAVKRNHEPTLNCLLKNGADPTIIEKNGISALHLAAFRGNDDAIRTFIRWKVDLNAKDEDGRTPLFLANHISTAKLLLQNSADPKILSDSRTSALHRAACFGRYEIVSALLSHGANVNTKSNNGLTAHDVAQKLSSDDEHVMTKDFKSNDFEQIDFEGLPETIRLLEKAEEETSQRYIPDLQSFLADI